MKYRSLLLAFLTCLSLTAQGQSVPTSSSLESTIDQSLRWLRAQQSEDGSYGDLLSTAQVLISYAESPRAYRHADGPFVSRAASYLLGAQRSDGAFAAIDSEQDQAVAQTSYAVLALEKLGDPGAREALVRARAFLGSKEGRPALPAFGDLSTDALQDLAAGSLVERSEEGYWGQGEARIRETAWQVFELSRIQRELASRKPAREPSDAVPLPAFSPAEAESIEAARQRGARFLFGQIQDGGWGFEGRVDPGITAMVTGALLTLPEPRPADIQAAIDRALDGLVALQKPDGSIHAGQLANYVTSASVLALVAAGREQDAAVIKRARGFLQGLQADEGEGYGRGDRFYGGVGYGGDERPDLSNMQMALEALSASGLEQGDETFRKALVFLQRCQNRSESNDLVLEADGKTIASGDDGGAGYAPGDSKAGFVELADGKRVPRSYGSMTYALLKGYLFAGLPKEDPRVEAVWKWISANYTLDVNPGFEASDDPRAAYQGLFYYFYTMARSLDLYGSDTVVDAGGRAHAWRSELAGRLTAMQRQDGSWLNTNASRWYEGNPVLASAYALLALDSTLP